VTIAANGYRPKHATARDPSVQLAMEEVDSGLVKLTISTQENAAVQWQVHFERP
ncbi:MAG: hypothetical protein GY809_20310, partial [Planctomycetes bacterium]|nr:hypothetical protein [Planctomycetota bacterium]